MTNSFAARYPQGVDLWHPTANGALTPDQVLGGSPEPMWWKCPHGPDHEWEVSPLVLGKGSLAHGRRGCPFCAGKRASVTNSVASYPHLAAEWHPDKNDHLTPDQVVAGTARKLWWRCTQNPEHEWPASGANRTRKRGCPRCKKGLRSALEVCLAFELAQFLPGLDPDDGEAELGRDTRKTSVLTAAGYQVMRVREQPLEAITASDVVIAKDATVKQTADAVLRKLRAVGWLSSYLDDDSIDAYLAEADDCVHPGPVQHV